MHLLLVAAGLGSLPGQALAQQAAAARTEPQAEPQAKPDKVQEIVVTASRRAERLQDVPLSVVAANAVMLSNAGVQNVTELGNLMSGVTYGRSPGDQGFHIRGAGQMGGFSSASETPVGVVVDGVVYGLGQGFDSLGDVERVEVLKGPQGTQFGKNASSGAISITTPNPSMDRVKGDLFLSYGNDAEGVVRANANLPMGDSVAARLSVYHRKHDGYVDNLTRGEQWGGETEKGLRAKLLFKPTSQLEALVIADVSRSDTIGPGQAWTLRQAGPGLGSGYPFRGGPRGDIIPAGVVPGPDNRVSFEDAAGFVEVKRSGVSVEVNYALGGYTLTSLSAYRTDKTRTSFGIDGTALDIMSANNYSDRSQSTQELRVTSPKGGWVEYVAGYYYYKQPTDIVSNAYLRPGLPFAPTYVALNNGIAYSHSESVSHALFADGKVPLGAGGHTKLLFGARVNRDSVEAGTFSVVDPRFNPALTAPYKPVAPTAGETAETGKSGRLGLEHRIHKDLLLYGTMATGYLGPTVTFSGLTNVRSNVKPQKVRDVTLGVKAQFLKRWITLNASVFHDKYTDLQTAVFNGSEFVTENAGGARSRGLELDLAARLTEQLRLRVSATYADAVFTDYETACPGAADAALCNGPVVNGRPLFYQAAGNNIPGSPKLTSVLGLDYSTEIGDDHVMDASANYSHRTKTEYQPGVPAFSQGGYGVLNLAAHYGPSDYKWRLGVYVRNAFDRRYQAAVLGLPFSRAGSIINWNAYEATRHAGVTLELRY